MPLRLPKIKSVFGWLLAGILLLGFGSFILFFAALFATGLAGQGVGLWRMQHWTGHSTGVVQSVAAVSGNGTHNTSTTHIAYTYTVDGHPFTGTHIGPEWEWISGTETGGGSVADAFSQGQSVTVHYNPDRPEEAFLWTKMKKSPLGFPLAFLAIVAGGYAGVRQRNKRTHDGRWLIATTLAGLGAGGFVLLFAFPIYVEPMHAAWVLGGGMALGLAWGLCLRTADLRAAASDFGIPPGMSAEAQRVDGIVADPETVRWRWWDWRNDLLQCAMVAAFSCIAPIMLWPMVRHLTWPQTTGDWIGIAAVAGLFGLFSLMPLRHALALLFNTTSVRIDDGTLVITTAPLGRFWGKRVSLSDVLGLESTTKRRGKSGTAHLLMAQRGNGKKPVKLLDCDGNGKRLAGQGAVRTMVEDWLKRERKMGRK